MPAMAFDDVLPHCSHNHISQLQTILAVGVSANKLGKWPLPLSRPTFF